MENDVTTKVKVKKISSEELSKHTEQLTALGVMLELQIVESYDSISCVPVLQCPFTEDEQDKIKAKMFDIIDGW